MSIQPVEWKNSMRNQFKIAQFHGKTEDLATLSSNEAVWYKNKSYMYILITITLFYVYSGFQT